MPTGPLARSYSKWRSWTTQHEERSIQSNYHKVAPKGVFINLLEKCLGMNAGLWSSVCVWFRIFEKSFENFCDAFERGSVWDSSYHKWQYWLWVLRNWFYWVIKVLMWSIYSYHRILPYVERRKNGKRLVAHVFHSWQIS